MLNQVVLVGRVKNTNREKNTIELVIPGQNEEDKSTSIRVYLTEDMMNNMENYVEDLSIVGVKGTLKNTKGYGIKVVASKITFLSSRQ